MKTMKGLLFCLSAALIFAVSVEANPTIKIKQDIFAAIDSIDYISLNILLAEGANIDKTDQNGNTPLMVAAKVGNHRILDIILSHNPNINKHNKGGKTALIIAAETGQLSVVEKLLAHNDETSIKDHDNNTALTLTSKFGHKKIVDLIKDMRTQTTLAK